MRNWFRQSSVILRALSLLADVALLNLLWLLCSIPILTMGASTTALYACLFARQRGESCGARAFFCAFRAHFRRATALWAIALFSGIVLYADARFTLNASFPLHQVLLALYAALALVLLISLPFLFVAPALEAKTVLFALRSSLLLGIGVLPRTVAVLLLWSVPVIWLVLSPYSFLHLAWIWVGVGFGGIAFLSAELMKKSSNSMLGKPEQENANHSRS